MLMKIVGFCRMKLYACLVLTLCAFVLQTYAEVSPNGYGVCSTTVYSIRYKTAVLHRNITQNYTTCCRWLFSTCTHNCIKTRVHAVPYYKSVSQEETSLIYNCCSGWLASNTECIPDVQNEQWIERHKLSLTFGIIGSVVSIVLIFTCLYFNICGKTKNNNTTTNDTSHSQPNLEDISPPNNSNMLEQRGAFTVQSNNEDQSSTSGVRPASFVGNYDRLIRNHYMERSMIPEENSDYEYVSDVIQNLEVSNLQSSTAPSIAAYDDCIF